MKILAIGAHCDDVELGCGGALLAWKEHGHSLSMFVATNSGYSDARGNVIRTDSQAQSECINAAQMLGAALLTGGFSTFSLEFAEPLNVAVIRAIDEVQPDIVLTHWDGDVHHDHRALALSTIQCCRHLPRLLLYRSNWYQSTRVFNPRFFVDISGVLDRKCSLVALYESENSRTSNRWIAYIRAQALIMGLHAGVSAAEGFEVVKWLD